jgi:hypothetical protein
MFFLDKIILLCFISKSKFLESFNGEGLFSSDIESFLLVFHLEGFFWTRHTVLLTKL